MMESISIIFTIVSVVFAITGMALSILPKKKETNDIEDELNNVMSAFATSEAGTKTAGIPSNPKEQSILKLMMYNMKVIKVFYSTVLDEVRKSFTLTSISFIVGFLLFGAAFTISMVKDSSTVSVLVPAISGAIVELLSGTSLIMYKKSQEQLNVFYKFLHENERFLSAVKIAESITPENRDKAYSDIIQSQIRAQTETTA